MNKKLASKKNGTWSSAAARRLMEMAGNPSSVEDAVRIVVERYLDGIVCPPTDLDAVAQRAGVTKIYAEDLPVSGELRHEDKSLSVVYSTYLSAARRRFTIAHEIGHAVFERTGARPPRTGEELERLCDMMASEMLMPHDVFTNLTDGPPSLRNLLEVSQRFKTSLSATSIRYAKLKKVSVFHLEGDGITWGYGAVKKGSLRFLDYSLQSAIAGAVNGESRYDTVFLNHRQRCSEWSVDHQLLGDGKKVLFMLRPKHESVRPQIL